MNRPLELEGRSIDWSELIASYSVEQVPGINILFGRPPFVGFVSASDPRYSALREELVAGGLLTSLSEAHRLLDAAIRPQLANAMAALFADAAQARAVLDNTLVDGRALSPRLALALVQLSNGELSKLRDWCKRAQADYRDVYQNAWYSKEGSAHRSKT